LTHEPWVIEGPVLVRQFSIQTEWKWPIAPTQHNATNLSDANSANFAADGVSGLESKSAAGQEQAFGATFDFASNSP
jgi:hypothetical protein